MPTLDIFEHRFGDETKPTNLSAGDDNTLGEAGMRMLDAVQTIVDVISDDRGYEVGFANTASAFTEHGKRRITISGLPLFRAAPGTSYRDIAAILTGFAVHEVGHTKKVGIIDAVRAEWPGKKIPATLANVVEDMVLEARTVERYLGLTDVFDPTLEWVARETCPAYPLKWEGSTGHKVNIVGQIARYRDFVTFTADSTTQRQLRWFEEWADAITASMTPAEGVAHVKAALDHIHEPIEDEDETEPGGDEPNPEPPTEGGEPGGEGGEGGETSGPSIPDEEDDDDTEGDDDEPGEGNDGDDTEGEDEGPDGGVDTGKDGDDIDGEDTEGGDEPGGETNGQGHGTDADTMDRSEAEQGTNDGPGAGGSGQAIAEAGDEDPDAGLDETELDKSFDDFTETTAADHVLQTAVEEERITSRLDAGVHGKMRVIFR